MKLGDFFEISKNFFEQLYGTCMIALRRCKCLERHSDCSKNSPNFMYPHIQKVETIVNERAAALCVTRNIHSKEAGPSN